MVLSLLVPVAAFAQGEVTCAEEATIQKDDSLSKLADKYFGNVLSWPALMEHQNMANKAMPDKYTKIDNADVIEVGQTLCVPSEEDANTFLAAYDPAKPELLFAGGEAGKLVIGSWWTAGGEAEGLNEMFRIYQAEYPDVEIVNATVAGGAGTNFKAVLKTRLLGGDPPDTFQLHAGLEVQTYSPEEYIATLDDLYASEGLLEAFPPDLIDMLKYQGHFWGVPVNIHRSNVLWYDKATFEANGVTPPTNMDEFVAVSEKLKAAGVVPFVIGTNGGWEAAQVLEDVLAGTLGAEKYKGLWNGTTSWNDPEVTTALESFKTMMSYANTDHPALSWDGAAEYLIDGKGGMMIMGDWADGWFTSKGYTGYGLGASSRNPGHFRRSVRQLRHAQERSQRGERGGLAEGLRFQGRARSLQPQEGFHLRPHGL